MTDSLRDQLLKLGFKKPEPPARPAAPVRSAQRPPAGKPSAAGQAGKPGAAGPSAKPQRPGANAQNRNPQRPQERTQQRPGQGNPSQQQQRPKSAAPRSQEEIDLARAYALRDRQEREEKETARREAEAKARERRERRLRLQALVQGKTVNDPAAELLRHFPHRDKIKRVHVNEAQLAALNTGALGVVQIEGRYLLVDRETALAVQAVFEDALVLLPELGGQDEDEALASEPPSIAAS